MIIRLLIVVAALCVAPAAAQTIQLSGTVTNAVGGAPLPHVIVSLKNKPTVKDTTGVDGAYTLTGGTAVVSPVCGRAFSEAGRLHGSCLEFATQGIEPVSVDIFTASGAKAVSVFKSSFLVPGTYNVDLLHRNLAPGLYLVRYQQGQTSSVLSYASVNSHQAFQLNQDRFSGQALAAGTGKLSAAAIDTLIFFDSSFTTAKSAVASYSGQNDMAMQPGPPTYWVFYNGVQNWPGDWSYGATANWSDAAGNPLSGTIDIKVTVTGQWGGFQPYANGNPPHQDMTPYNYFTIALKPTAANQYWTLYFSRDPDQVVGTVQIPVNKNGKRYGPTPVVGEWATYTIPLSDGGLAGIPARKFSLVDQTGLTSNTYYVDNIGFMP